MKRRSLLKAAAAGLAMAAIPGVALAQGAAPVPWEMYPHASRYITAMVHPSGGYGDGGYVVVTDRAGRSVRVPVPPVGPHGEHSDRGQAVHGAVRAGWRALARTSDVWDTHHVGGGCCGMAAMHRLGMAWWVVGREGVTDEDAAAVVTRMRDGEPAPHGWRVVVADGKIA